MSCDFVSSEYNDQHDFMQTLETLAQNKINVYSASAIGNKYSILVKNEGNNVDYLKVPNHTNKLYCNDKFEVGSTSGTLYKALNEKFNNKIPNFMIGECNSKCNGNSGKTDIYYRTRQYEDWM